MTPPRVQTADAVSDVITTDDGDIEKLHSRVRQRLAVLSSYSKVYCLDRHPICPVIFSSKTLKHEERDHRREIRC